MPVNPTSVLAGDLNGDGAADLIYGFESGATPSFTATLQVLLADGHGGYTAAQTITMPTGGFPRCVLHDLNGDKAPDLVCGSLYSGTVSIFVGRGDGSFGVPMILTVPDTQDQVVPATVGDLNGDGAPDVLLFVGNGLSLYSLLNDGKANFTLAEAIAASVYGSQVTLADLNEDGHPDLLIQAASLNTQVMLGKGDGTFTALEQFSGNSSAALADIDGDGHLDLVGGQAGILRIFHGNADGTFGSSPIAKADFTDGNAGDDSGSGVYGHVFAVRDLDGDGILDVLAFGNNGLTVLPGKAGLTFGTPRSFPVGADLFFGPLAAGQQYLDMDGDGSLDFVAPGANGIYISYGRADGSFASADVYASGNATDDVSLADFDEDGFPDAVRVSGLQIELSRGQANGTFLAPTAISPPLPYTGSAARYVVDRALHGDINGDGHEDLVVVAASSPAVPTLYVLSGHGDGTFSAPARVPQMPQNSNLIQVLDVNQDGRADVVFQAADYSLTILLSQADGSFKTSSIPALSSPTETAALRIADASGDGIPDVIRAFGASVTVLPGKGDGTFGAGVTYMLPTLNPGTRQTAVDVAAGDFNGDGHLDMSVLLALYDQNGSVVPDRTQLVTFYGQGTQADPGDSSFSSAVPGPISIQSYRSLTVADLNGDGISDLVAEGPLFASFPFTLGTFEGRADKSFEAENSFAAGTYLTAPQIADLNQDGRPDLAVGNTEGNAFTVLLSEGPAIPTGTLLAHPNPVARGAAFTITATVQVGGQRGTLNGNVTFSVDQQTLGTATLVGGVASLAGPTTLSPGFHALTALTSALTTNQGANYAPVHLTGRVIVQAQGTAVTLTGSPNPTGTGQEVSFNVAVANAVGAPSAAGQPTGTVNVTVAGKSIGTVTLATSTGGGTGTLKYTFQTPGSYTVTASYSGDGTHAGSTASVVEDVQTAPDFSLGLSTPVVTVAAGQDGSVVVSLGSLNRFAGTLRITESALPTGLAGSLDPDQALLPSGGQVTSTLRFSAGKGPAGAARVHARLTLPGAGGKAALALACALPLGFAGRRRRRPGLLLVIAGALVAMMSFGGCTNLGVPLLEPGTYPVTITATDAKTGLTHTATLQVVLSSGSATPVSGPR